MGKREGKEGGEEGEGRRVGGEGGEEEEKEEGEGGGRKSNFHVVRVSYMYSETSLQRTILKGSTFHTK